MSWLSRLANVFRTSRLDRDLDEEQRFHLDARIEALVQQGLTRDDAEDEAARRFGNPVLLREQSRDIKLLPAMESLSQDLRYAWRALRRNSIFTVATVFTLALGIGVTTAMFSVVNGVMLRPLPYHDSSRVVLLWTDDVKRGLHFENTAYLTIADWQGEAKTFADIAFVSAGRATLSSGSTRERTRAAFVSANLLPLLGVPPALGRSLTSNDERTAAPVAVISNGLWQRRFASTPDIVGRLIVLERPERIDTMTVVGVMPAGFSFPDRQTEVWVPATTYWRWTRESVERFPSWARRWIGVGRLKPGVSDREARADLARIGDHLTATQRTDVADFPGFAVNVVPMIDYVTGVRLQTALWLLMGAVALVLLIACANVGNLLLARGTARQHEIAVRRALGASRRRLVRQLLVESVMLAALGGAAGVLLAAPAIRVLAVVAANQLPRLNEITIDTNVLVFAAATAIVSAVLFGLLPAIRITGIDAAGRLRDAGALGGGPRIRRTRGLLVVAECCIAVVLLVGAGLLLRSLARVHAVDPGFDASRALLIRIEFPRETGVATAEQPRMSDAERARSRAQLLDDLVARVAALPDVESAGFVDDMFITGQGNESITFPGRDATLFEAGELHEATATPGFFSALRVPLRRGRYLSRDDALMKIRALWTPIDRNLALDQKARRVIAEPVVVNEAFVRRFLREIDPIGERFCIDPMNKTYCYEIVGVVGDMHRQGPERTAIPEYYGPLIPSPLGRADLLVRTRGNPVAAAGSIRETILAVMPTALMPEGVTTAASALGAFSAQRNLQTWLLTLFASLALTLAAIGIYGIVHYAVAQRTREIGVRIALGARPRDVVRLVIAGGMRFPLVGTVLGLVAAFLITRVMRHLLFEVGTTDVITFTVVAATLVAAAFAACYGPARHAARLDAVAALRLE